MTSRRTLARAVRDLGRFAARGLLLAWMPADAASGDPDVSATHVGRRGRRPCYSQTKQLHARSSRTTVTTYSFPTNTVTVSADQTQDLRGRAADPDQLDRRAAQWRAGQQPLRRERPPTGVPRRHPPVPRDRRPEPADRAAVRPETCWTDSVAQRSQMTRTEARGRRGPHDLLAAPAATGSASAACSRSRPKAECADADQDPFYTQLTPFVAASREGLRRLRPPTTCRPRPRSGRRSRRPSSRRSPTSTATARCSFEVRSDVENESLGCNHKVACSIVVIPINGICCDRARRRRRWCDAKCRPVDSSRPGPATSPTRAWTRRCRRRCGGRASNWRNRFTIPITFGLPPDTCDVLDPRAPTGFYGSELMAQASLQWAPAYCLEQEAVQVPAQPDVRRRRAGT